MSPTGIDRPGAAAGSPAALREAAIATQLRGSYTRGMLAGSPPLPAALIGSWHGGWQEFAANGLLNDKGTMTLTVHAAGIGGPAGVYRIAGVKNCGARLTYDGPRRLRGVTWQRFTEHPLGG